ncbi:metallophosphoesterase [Chachezhania sediminis]|uniref:metallophosphoesterase n=1 Tax=Chachezhania sediminis TaxID=2599291 RepID=UPI00131D18CB|nr:metallophosphoesterase [Chachezhania sediminis]
MTATTNHSPASRDANTRVGGPATARLRILATTDLHMNLTGHDYFADRPDPAAGLTRLAPLIAKARAEAGDAAVLLVDNGDALQGTPMGDVAALPWSDLDPEGDTHGDKSGDKDAPHPAMLAFGHLGYDVLGLGNHDFDFGLPALARALTAAPCPVLSSNLVLNTGPDGPAFPDLSDHTVLDVVAGPAGPLRVGVLSLLPPQTRTWVAHATNGQIEVGDMVNAARATVARLRNKDCDVILALAHTGFGAAEAKPGMENAVLPVAALDGIDAVVAGHTHRRFPGPDHEGLAHVDAKAGLVHGKPTVMPGAGGRLLGVIDLDLIRGEDGKWQAAGGTSQLRSVSGDAPEDAGLARVLQPGHARTRACMSRPLGATGAPLHSYFSLFAADRSLSLLAAAQKEAVRPHLSGTGAGDLPLLVALSPARTGGLAGPGFYTDVPAGPLLERHVADLCPFADGLAVVILTRERAKLWLEQSASGFLQVAAGAQDAPLLDPLWAGHQFDMLFGLDYAIDVGRPAGFAANGMALGPAARIRLSGKGRPDDRFAVITSGYRAAGGGHIRALDGVTQLSLPPVGARGALRRYLARARDAEAVVPDADGPWRFAPLPGTTVRVPTGPGARAHLSDLGARLLDTSDNGSGGFLSLRLDLSR